MTSAVIDQLYDAFTALRDALDGDDIAKVDAATARVNKAVADVKAVGAWRDEFAVRARLDRLLPLMEAARVRTSFLADQTRQRIALLAERGSIHAPLTYGR
ncbi:hypothetical protein BH10PSE12_BH10PSE12_23930 [soil metagenome]